MATCGGCASGCAFDDVRWARLRVFHWPNYDTCICSAIKASRIRVCMAAITRRCLHDNELVQCLRTYPLPLMLVVVAVAVATGGFGVHLPGAPSRCGLPSTRWWTCALLRRTPWRAPSGRPVCADRRRGRPAGAVRRAAARRAAVRRAAVRRVAVRRVAVSASAVVSPLRVGGRLAVPFPGMILGHEKISLLVANEIAIERHKATSGYAASSSIFVILTRADLTPARKVIFVHSALGACGRIKTAGQRNTLQGWCAETRAGAS